jgi:hypothetical protein
MARQGVKTLRSASYSPVRHWQAARIERFQGLCLFDSGKYRKSQLPLAQCQSRNGRSDTFFPALDTGPSALESPHMEENEGLARMPKPPSEEVSDAVPRVRMRQATYPYCRRSILSGRPNATRALAKPEHKSARRIWSAPPPPKSTKSRKTWFSDDRESGRISVSSLIDRFVL